MIIEFLEGNAVNPRFRRRGQERLEFDHGLFSAEIANSTLKAA